MGQGQRGGIHPGAISPASQGWAIPDKTPTSVISFNPLALTEFISLLLAASLLLGPPQPFTEKVY